MANRYRRRSVPPSGNARRLSAGDDSRKHGNSCQVGNSGLHHSAYLANVKKCQRAAEPLYFRQYLPNFLDKSHGFGFLNRIRAKVGNATKVESKHKLLKELLSDNSATSSKEANNVSEQQSVQEELKNTEEIEEEVESIAIDQLTIHNATSMEPVYIADQCCQSEEKEQEEVQFEEIPTVMIIDDATSYRESDLSIRRVESIVVEARVETRSEATGSQAAIVLEEDASTSTECDNGAIVNETCVQTAESIFNTKIFKTASESAIESAETKQRIKLGDQLKHLREMARGETSSITTSAGVSPSISVELNPTINSAAGSIADNSEIQLQFSEPFSRKDFSPTISPQKMHDRLPFNSTIPDPPKFTMLPPKPRPITCQNPVPQPVCTTPPQLPLKPRMKQIRSQRSATKLRLRTLQRQKEELQRQVSKYSQNNPTFLGGKLSYETISRTPSSINNSRHEYTFVKAASNENNSANTNPFTHHISSLDQRRTCNKGDDCPKCDLNVPQMSRLCEKPSLFTRAFVPPPPVVYDPSNHPRITSKPTYVFNTVIPQEYNQQYAQNPSQMSLPPVYQDYQTQAQQYPTQSQQQILLPTVQIQHAQISQPQQHQQMQQNTNQLQQQLQYRQVHQQQIQHHQQMQQLQQQLQQHKKLQEQKMIIENKNIVNSRAVNSKNNNNDSEESKKVIEKCSTPCEKENKPEAVQKPQNDKKQDSILCYDCSRKLIDKKAPEKPQQTECKRPSTGYCRSLINDFENKIHAQTVSANARYKNKYRDRIYEKPMFCLQDQFNQKLHISGGCPSRQSSKEHHCKHQNHHCKQNAATCNIMWDYPAQNHNIANHHSLASSRRTSADSLARCSLKNHVGNERFKPEIKHCNVQCSNYQTAPQHYSQRLKSAGDSSYSSNRPFIKCDYNHKPYLEDIKRRQ